MRSSHASPRPAGPAGPDPGVRPPEQTARQLEVVIYRSGGWELPALVTAALAGRVLSLIVFEPSGRQRPEHGVPWWRSPGARGRSWRHCDGPGAADAARAAWPGVGSPEGL